VQEDGEKYLVWNVSCVHFIRYYKGGGVKEHEIGEICSTDGTGEQWIQTFIFKI
jgi:hypothetical protein